MQADIRIKLALFDVLRSKSGRLEIGIDSQRIAFTPLNTPN